jgi:hypothetical protein
MKENQASLKDPRIPLSEIPCVCDETLQPAGATRNAVSILRKLLDVPDGVLIMEKATEAKLEETPCSVWIRGILSFLITDFVFHNGSPFEDATLWRKTLKDCKRPNESKKLEQSCLNSLLTSAKPATLTIRR